VTRPMVDVRGIHKSFGPLEVLRGVDLRVRAGEVVVILGPSGSGKSTLLRSINHLERVNRGRRHRGDGVDRRPAGGRRHLGVQRVQGGGHQPGARDRPGLRGPAHQDQRGRAGSHQDRDDRVGPEADSALTGRIPLGRWARAREQAEVVWFLSSPAASYATGAVLPADGGLSASNGLTPSH
jgi:energy-coupling factor transporter ATP-binding protein EcfA2